MKTLIKKYSELIKYVLCGLLTTLVNYIVHFTLRAFGVNYYISLTLAGVIAVIFAYVTNRIFVFESKVQGIAIIKEFVMFLSGRVMSFVLELIISFVFIDLLHADSLIWQPDFVSFTIPLGELGVKTFCMGFVVVANYIFSKFVIFKKKKQ